MFYHHGYIKRFIRHLCFPSHRMGFHDLRHLMRGVHPIQVPHTQAIRQKDIPDGTAEQHGQRHRRHRHHVAPQRRVVAGHVVPLGNFARGECAGAQRTVLAHHLLCGRLYPLPPHRMGHQPPLPKEAVRVPSHLQGNIARKHRNLCDRRHPIDVVDSLGKRQGKKKPLIAQGFLSSHCCLTRIRTQTSSARN